MMKSSKHWDQMEEWILENGYKTVDWKTIGFWDHPFKPHISRYQNIFLATIVNDQMEEGEIYFCFGHPFLGGFSDQMKTEWKKEIKSRTKK
ncbi:hypothetical protein PQO01_04840 [Lentisphaera marina]|uniref:hypothetical protein n=1 Tax=Lentisphaera marina TaxID=1111041 RepID=UPI0023659B1B|nr:hypothetical protein [Lentisphaera marina]MDD7984272.1 hypothetical protein [Lentisphaera marina]